jgi:ubiquinone/menaquinone biosynthesis C-methylase UbiE
MSGSEHEYWGKLARTFHGDALYVVGSDVYQEVEGWLQKQFRDTDTVLELGCGTGFFSEMIADRVKHLAATDLAPEMIEQANKNLSQFSNVELKIEDSYATSFKDDVFDALLLVNLLHIVESPVTVLKESHRVLSSDGRIVIVDVTGHGMSLLKKMKLVIRYLRKFGKPPSNNKSFSQDELAAMLKEAGFSVEEIELIGNDTKAVCLTGKKDVSYTQSVE